MIIWLNGAFGAGKTTTAQEVARQLPNARHFDAEAVGGLLMHSLSDHEFVDFQDLPPWRVLFPIVTEQLATFTGQHLVTVQTVLREDYWRELADGFRRTAPSLDIFHVLLHVDPDALAERIRADETAPVVGTTHWRLDRIGAYEKARPWLESAADLVIDTSHRPASDAAALIAAAAGRRIADAGRA